MSLIEAIKSASNLTQHVTAIGSQSSIVEYLTYHLNKIYYYIIVFPLAKLYLWGPSFGGWGFWGGMDMAEICAQKTTLSSEFWKRNPEECAEIVSKQFYSMTILIETIVYFYLLIQVLVTLCYKCRRNNKKIEL